jgi:hypothetical protein
MKNIPYHLTFIIARDFIVPPAIEYRMSKEGILSILSKKIERSDSTLRHPSLVIRFFRVSFSIRPAFFLPAAGLNTDT